MNLFFEKLNFLFLKVNIKRNNEDQRIFNDNVTHFYAHIFKCFFKLKKYIKNYKNRNGQIQKRNNKQSLDKNVLILISTWHFYKTFFHSKMFGATTLSLTTFSLTTLSITVLSAILLCVIMLSVAIFYCYAEFHHDEYHYAKCCYAACRYAECRSAEIHLISYLPGTRGQYYKIFLVQIYTFGLFHDW